MRRQVALTKGERLFIKNTGHRKAEMPSTMADACSLLVPESPVQREKGPVKSGGNLWSHGINTNLSRGPQTLDSDPLNEEQTALWETGSVNKAMPLCVETWRGSALRTR